jgi:hypothetical protein
MPDSKFMTDAETAELCDSIRSDLDNLDAELEYLRWFKKNADFGPAGSDVYATMDKNYTGETGKPVPTDWAQEG